MTIVRHDSVNLQSAYSSRQEDEESYYKKVGLIYDTKGVKKEDIDTFMRQLYHKDPKQESSHESTEEEITL